jgi:hypothetical protein
MGYLQDADLWLDALLRDVTEQKISVEELKRAIREKLLESYRNGLNATERRPAPRRGDFRRRNSR